MTAYRMEMRTRDQMAEDDPFGGGGIKLPFREGMTRADVAAAIEHVCGHLPYIVWDLWAWVDGRSLLTSQCDDVEDAWIGYLTDTAPSEGVEPTS